MLLRQRILLAGTALGLLGTAPKARAQVAPPPRPTLARLTGVVYDSIGQRPLSEALIQLVFAADPSRTRSVTADARGGYTIDSVPAGRYLLGFLHPRLDSLGFDSPLMQIDVRTEGLVRADLGIPSPRTLISTRCGAAGLATGQGLFMGTVRRARGDLPGPARVRAQWPEVTVGPSGVERRFPSHFTSSSPTGAFAICGAPAGGTITARAYVGPDSSGAVELAVPRNGLLIRDLLIGSSARAGLSLRGSGALRGVVRSATGQPVRNARLMLTGSGREDTTNASGQFDLQALPAGTYGLEARALGFTPRRIAVDIPDSAEAVVEVALDVFVPMIDTVRVKASRSAADDLFADFDRRRKTGSGYFIDSDQLNKRSPIYMSDVLRGTPGITISPGTNLLGDQILMRGTSGAGSCTPAVYLDGVRATMPDGTLDDLVDPQQVRAIEVYSRATNAPMSFQSANGCGTIVIWTGRRRSTP